MHVHHGTANVLARVVRVGDRFAQLRLAEPVVAARGDRVVLRAATTVGGGRVIDPSPPRHASVERMELVERGEIAATVHEPVRAESLAHLGELDGRRARRRLGLLERVARRAARRARRTRSTRADPLDPGIAAAGRARGRPPSCRCSGSSGAARSSTGPGATAELGARAEAAAALEAQLGLEPVKVDDAALARFLEEQGRLVRVGDGYAISAAAYEQARAALVAECEAAGPDHARPLPRPARRRAQDGAAPARALRRRRPDAPRRRRARPAPTWDNRAMNAGEVAELIERYNDAWNAQDLDDDPRAAPSRDRLRQPHRRRARRGRRRRARAHRADLREQPGHDASARAACTRGEDFAVCEWTLNVEKDGRDARVGRRRRLPDQERADRAEGRVLGVASSARTAELQHVRPVVVADRVEALPLGEQQRRIEVGVEDPLLVVERACEIRAVGCEDRAAAAAEQAGAFELRASGKSSGYDEARWKWHGETTYARLSRAMCTSVACHASPSSAVEAM